MLQVCEGQTEGKCQFSVPKRVHINRCVDHPNAKLMDSGPCAGYFLYLRPESEKDNRRWLAFLSAEGLKAVHSHPCPVRSKLGSRLEEVIQEAVKNDPSKTTKEISKGIILYIFVCRTILNCHFIGNFSFIIFRCGYAMQPCQSFSGCFEFRHPSQLRKKS